LIDAFLADTKTLHAEKIPLEARAERARGKTVDAHYYANEGHGFEKRENQIDSIRRTVEWMDKYLKGR
jgi:dipeptidyl aminopeptidase/acylaminoacyl peptidase